MHLHGEPLATDDLTDLSLLSLDAVAVIHAAAEAAEPLVSWAHLLPENPDGNRWEVHEDLPAHRIEVDFPAFIREIEGEIGRKARMVEADGAETGTTDLYASALLSYMVGPTDWLRLRLDAGATLRIVTPENRQSEIDGGAQMGFEAAWMAYRGFGLFAAFRAQVFGSQLPELADKELVGLVDVSAGLVWMSD